MNLPSGLLVWELVVNDGVAPVEGLSRIPHPVPSIAALPSGQAALPPSGEERQAMEMKADKGGWVGSEKGLY